MFAIYQIQKPVNFFRKSERQSSPSQIEAGLTSQKSKLKNKYRKVF